MSEQILDFFTSPEVIALADAQAVERNGLIQSGAIVYDTNLQKMATSGSQEIVLPWNNQLDPNEEPNYSNTNPSQVSTPLEMSGSKAKAMVAYQNQSWQIASLLSSVIRNNDPAGSLVRMLAQYRRSVLQRRLVATLKGIIEDNIANDGGDMVKDIYTDGAGAPTAANKISLKAIIEATLTSGDHRDSYRYMAAHSTTIASLEILDADGFTMEKDSQGMIPDIKVYRGMKVIEDDMMTVVDGTNHAEYYTYFLGNGAIAWADAPVEAGTDRAAIETVQAAAKGGGSNIYYYRWADVLNPYGISYLDAVRTEFSPSLVNLANPLNWDRIVHRKLVPIACLTHNN
jgi:hypothetical protein